MAYACHHDIFSGVFVFCSLKVCCINAHWWLLAYLQRYAISHPMVSTPWQTEPGVYHFNGESFVFQTLVLIGCSEEDVPTTIEKLAQFLGCELDITLSEYIVLETLLRYREQPVSVEYLTHHLDEGRWYWFDAPFIPQHDCSRITQLVCKIRAQLRKSRKHRAIIERISPDAV
jgi:hypothetical protein